ncbi:eukaryotic translation initiation factor SUI1 family protein [Roridomyces roridus]|uniref:Eukaryotic translation initiation factor SUI1 family protein n=1 Tax=Roridomyces roridus TaxID=1738132 RepID=A0AAD7BFF7_9AGAR|nr:eukaryotic translation initiation factor SUI1 family protein [Roridomyces roridus]
MFKKPLHTLKTSAPLRSSDRRKLKQRVIDAFTLDPELGDALVPEGILTIKFNTHLDEPGVAYLSPEASADPLWFSLGKGSEELIPSVYTLWKRPDLLPFLSTPPAVIPILVGGADLMIPGVVHHPSDLKEGQLVAVCQYTHRSKNGATLSVPLAVGRMAVAGDRIQDGEKGKAVFVLHVWKDFLWDMGGKPQDMPEQRPLAALVDQPESEAAEGDEEIPVDKLTITAQPAYTPAEISTLLQASLLQALSTKIPASAFPLSASVFYETYILLFRPAFPHSVLPPGAGTENSSDIGPGNPQNITIKSSAHKSLTAFLKAMDKAGLLTSKTAPKQNELLVTAVVDERHPSVAAHRGFVTLGEVEARAAKKAVNEEKKREKEEEGGRRVEVRELCKASGRTIGWVEGVGGSPKTLYEPTELRTLLNAYITDKGLVNPREQAYVNVGLDPLLLGAVVTPPKKGVPQKEVEFMKRDEVMKGLLDGMQAWYEVRVGGREVVLKKGALKPIRVEVKMRQGRKACTLVSGFEAFGEGVVDAEEMSEELRKICAGATSVSPRVGGPTGTVEVLVQGKQAKVVVDYLTEKRGVPKKWVEVVDLVGGKK